MHELGIVFSMIDVLEDAAKENNLDHIEKVTVELGEVSGVVTDFFKDAWEWASSKNELLKGAELEIVTTEAISVCNDCGKTYRTLDHAKICPHCNSSNTELLRGRELEIASIEVL